jgi:hypothetical protein
MIISAGEVEQPKTVADRECVEVERSIRGTGLVPPGFVHPVHLSRNDTGRGAALRAPRLSNPRQSNPDQPNPGESNPGQFNPGTRDSITRTRQWMTHRNLTRDGVEWAEAAMLRGREHNRIDVRREPLVVRDGCSPERIPPGRWPSDDALVRSEQFAVNAAITELADAELAGDGGLFAVHAPQGTGVAEVFGDLVAAIVTRRACRLVDLPEPAAAFGESRILAGHAVSALAPALAGFEIVLAQPERSGLLAGPRPGAMQHPAVKVVPVRVPARPALGLPPVGARWRDRAIGTDYFVSTARLADGIGAWAMLGARLGTRHTNRAFVDRWWHGMVRGADVLFPSGESLAAALRRLADEKVDWPAAVGRFRAALESVEALAAERMRVAAALSRLSALEQAWEEASCSAEAAQARLADLTGRDAVAREAVASAEEDYRGALADLGAHDLGRPELGTVTKQGVVALFSHDPVTVAVAGGIRRGRTWWSWSAARRRLRTACLVAELRWEAALRDAEELRAEEAAARDAMAAETARVAGLASEMEPLAQVVSAARKRWGDHVPAGPSQAETEDHALIEWRETSAPWADEKYASARAEVFIAALELHKALITAQAGTIETNLAALMDLLRADAPDSDPGEPGEPGEPGDPGGEADRHALAQAAWQTFFLVVPVLHVPFEAAGELLSGLAPGSLGWLLAGETERLAGDDVPRLLAPYRRAVFAGDALFAGDAAGGPGTAGEPARAPASAQHLADRMVRYGTSLSAGRPGTVGGTEPRWVGTPLRVVRGQDRTAVDKRNDIGYDGLLIAERD